MTQILRFVTKVLTSVLLTLILLEIGLRLFPGLIPFELLAQFYSELRAEIAHRRGLPTEWDTITIERDDYGPPLKIYKPFTTIVWPVKENNTFSTMVMDEVGFCNPPQNPYHLSKIEVITLGDSFTFCTSIDANDTWSSQLSLLTNLPVYNLSRGNIGILEYLQLLKKFGLQKSPRVVIMNIYAGNDLRDAEIYVSYRQNPMTIIGDNRSPSYIPSLLERYSYTYNLANSFMEYGQKANLWAALKGEPVYIIKAGQPNFKYRLVFPNKIIPFNPMNTDTDEVRYAYKLHLQQIDPAAYAEIGEALYSFTELSRQHGFIPIITCMPSAYMVYSTNISFEDPSLNYLMLEFQRQQCHYLAQKSKELGFRFIDLTPALQTAAQEKGWQNLLYFRYNLHLTPTGHAVVAQILSQVLADLKISLQNPNQVESKTIPNQN